MLIIILAALLIGGTFFYLFRRNRTLAAVAATWPSAEGQITASEVLTRRDEGKLEYRPHVAYAFTVDGRGYEGSRVRFGFTRYGLAPSKQVCERYPVGSSVPIYYDPADPSRNVLERGKA